MFYVYVLRSQKTGRRYVGSCEDRDERLRRHNAGETRATRYGVTWIMIYSEPFATRLEAILVTADYADNADFSKSKT